MEINSATSATKTTTGALQRGWNQVASLPRDLAAKAAEMACNARKLGEDDPRRITHSLKVGMALTMVSLLYYYQPLYNNFDDTAIWAVMTVVVVFEFSVGATLGKGLNRAIATLLAGALGVGAHHLANLSGKSGKPVLLGCFVFLLATTSTFMRFFPKIKARYDYGFLIFILTFSLIAISGFREEEILEMAHRRLLTIFIGGATCVIVSICVCPVWAGEDLHNLVALNMEKLGNFLEGFGDAYFKSSKNTTEENPCLKGYKSVLGSKSVEEALANFARWEPCHGKFRFCHPWKQYLKLGILIRQCAYRIEALDGYLNTDAQVPLEVRYQIAEAFMEVSSEAGETLKELAATVRKMTRQQNPNFHVENSRNAVKKLKAMLTVGFWKDEDFLSVLPIGTVASLLIDVVECTEKVAEAVEELTVLARFEEIEPEVSPEKPRAGQDLGACPHVVVTVLDEPVVPVLSENGSCRSSNNQSVHTT